MLISKAAYAKRRGVSRQTVYDWIAKGDVVMSGSKIDVDATEQLQRKPTHLEGVQVSATDPVVECELEMSWGAFWVAVKDLDGKVSEPLDDAEVEQRVRNAARELNWDVKFLDDGGIFLGDGDTEYYFQQYDFPENAALAISVIRREICYVAEELPDDMDWWSEAGMIALAICVKNSQ